MSDYQRWELMENGTMIQSPDGGWVLVGDYSCLKREAYILSIEHQNLKAENARLKADLERLRKAGDAMERSLAFEYPDSPKVKDWRAAKEGKPSV